MSRRKIQIAVISDLHLGTFGCQARSVIQYLSGIEPEILVLNGDIIDFWQFNKHFFPSTHMQVIQEILHLLSKGTRVYYITGNHDEKLRMYSDLHMGNFTLTDKLVLNIDDKKIWIFHGDVFDATTRGSARIVAKMGGYGYDMLILLNQFMNWFLKVAGREKMSLSRKIKNSVKKAVSWIANFENTAADLAIDQGYDYVICGHIHQPQLREYNNTKGRVIYMNSGDWVEHCSALEYNSGKWNLHFQPEPEGKMKKQSSGLKQRIPDVMADAINLFIQPA